MLSVRMNMGGGGQVDFEFLEGDINFKNRPKIDRPLLRPMYKFCLKGLTIISLKN
jgi:hypothetical protein